ncbi:hypothetical protein [Lishizhenia sp.]|uniref:hypothetical protein n=1 Tax=Lishizhenia sp. TaxID=2497594 RepID=UPI00299D3F8A|nr:hypothetical protein [Lishizhenia sp.]MDX1445908.1 hypothetical protein [Lishizhenia sp.]
MKRILGVMMLVLVLSSCATREAYTNAIRDEWNLTDASKMKGVQFYTSDYIELVRQKSEGVKTTESDGSLVKSENTTSDRIIIPARTKCIFDSYGENGEIIIRFEPGAGRVLRFAMKENTTLDKYYFVAVWKNGKGLVEYGNEEYEATAASARAYLVVKLQKWKKEKRKDRVVRGMKV